MRAHIQTHSNIKPFSCGKCGKAFTLKSYLYKHEESSSCTKKSSSVRCTVPLHSQSSAPQYSGGLRNFGRQLLSHGSSSITKDAQVAPHGSSNVLTMQEVALQQHRAAAVKSSPSVSSTLSTSAGNLPIYRGAKIVREGDNSACYDEFDALRTINNRKSCHNLSRVLEI